MDCRNDDEISLVSVASSNRTAERAQHLTPSTQTTSKGIAIDRSPLLRPTDDDGPTGEAPQVFATPNCVLSTIEIVQDDIAQHGVFLHAENTDNVLNLHREKRTRLLRNVLR